MCLHVFAWHLLEKDVMPDTKTSFATGDGRHFYFMQSEKINETVLKCT